jgi:hypothetical protein
MVDNTVGYPIFLTDEEAKLLKELVFASYITNPNRYVTMDLGKLANRLGSAVGEPLQEDEPPARPLLAYEAARRKVWQAILDENLVTVKDLQTEYMSQFTPEEVLDIAETLEEDEANAPV